MTARHKRAGILGGGREEGHLGLGFAYSGWTDTRACRQQASPTSGSTPIQPPPPRCLVWQQLGRPHLWGLCFLSSSGSHPGTTRPARPLPAHSNKDTAPHPVTSASASRRHRTSRGPAAGRGGMLGLVTWMLEQPGTQSQRRNIVTESQAGVGPCVSPLRVLTGRSAGPCMGVSPGTPAAALRLECFQGQRPVPLPPAPGGSAVQFFRRAESCFPVISTRSDLCSDTESIRQLCFRAALWKLKQNRGKDSPVSCRPAFSGVPPRTSQAWLLPPLDQRR